MHSFALSLENGLQYHRLDVRINSGDDVATSCKNLVNVCLVTPEITELICIPRYLYLAKTDLHIRIRRAAIQKRRGTLERYGRINRGNDQATPGINLVGF